MEVTGSLLIFVFQFLGDSQSFLGTLATVLVLCLCLENNLILDLLDTSEKNFAKEKNDCLNNEELQNLINSLVDSPDYKKLSERAGQLRNVWGNAERSSEGNAIIRAHEDIKLGIMTYNEKFIPMQESEHLSDFRRVVPLAPFYALLFVGLLFVLDELGRVVDSACDAIVSFVALFMVFSSLFWLTIWTKYVYLWHRSPYSTTPTLWAEMVSEIRNIYVSLRRYHPAFHVIVVVSGLGIIGVYLWMIAIHTGARDMVWKILLPLIILSVGVAMELSYTDKATNRKTFELEYTRIIVHFLVFFVVSAFLAAVAICFLDRAYLYDYNDWVWARLSALGFIVLVGLVIPFVVPIYCYSHRQRRLRKEFEIKKREAETFYQTLRQQLAEAAAKI